MNLSNTSMVINKFCTKPNPMLTELCVCLQNCTYKFIDCFLMEMNVLLHEDPTKPEYIFKIKGNLEAFKEKSKVSNNYNVCRDCASFRIYKKLNYISLAILTL